MSETNEVTEPRRKRGKSQRKSYATLYTNLASGVNFAKPILKGALESDKPELKDERIRIALNLLETES